MRLPRAFIIAAMIALAPLTTVGFGTPLGDSGLREDAARQDIVLTAVTGDVTPLGHGLLAPLYPLPCPAGTTEASPARSCNDPKVQCANGATTVLGLTCPPAPPAAKPPPPPPVT
jgi:hypothetical protein